MDTQADIRTRLQGVEELRGIVRAMRTLAAGRVQQAEAGLESIRHYASLTQGAVDDVLAMAPEPRATLLAPATADASVFVLGSEHGFVGALNRALLTDFQGAGETERLNLMIVGSRCATVASELGLDVGWATPMTSHGGGVERVSRIIATEVYAAYGRSEGGPVKLVYPQRQHGGGQTVRHIVLLPFLPSRGDVVDPGPPPLRNLPPADLFMAVVAEHVFGQITLAVMETLAAVNAARLATMQAAHDNLETRYTALRARERQARQQDITTELMDIVTGSEAQR